MGARTGREFLEGLKDDRVLWLRNERVDDVTQHPELVGAAGAVAALFDLQHEHADLCLEPDSETGELVNVSHMIPRSKEDLQRRRRCLETFAEASVGLMGRSPDYINVTFAGFAGGRERWAAGGNDEGAENVIRYQREIARRDLSLTHTIVHPTIDKVRDRDFAAPGDPVPLHKVGETEHGIVVRGARILATLAPFADELAVYPSHPAPEGAEAYALAFSIPMNTPGLVFLCRDSASAVHAERFDRPLSSRFDEQDAFAIFDDVEVPRERVFADGNLEVYNSVLFGTWAPNVMQQTMIRAQTKLEFAWGLAARMAEIVNDTGPPTQMLLGEIRCYSELVYSALRLAEAEAFDYGEGAWFPDGRPFVPLRALVPQWFPRVNEIFHLIGSHNLLAAPSRAQLDDPTMRPLLDRYLHGAHEVDAEERAAVFRLAWDFVGSELGSRNELYERYYFGSGARHIGLAHLAGDRARADTLVDRMLGRPG
ncbi:MAG: 4-hydroxyphenylacetate 3-hydroxylase [Deltaproteobacteria bacterium]|jgi:4-hydroxyphenylacetate 3-monooxygenase oxygenase component|nr:4-hydroxyphenylacetate 3-hydroxylase [Deltaproteobacteria bacterium]